MSALDAAVELRFQQLEGQLHTVDAAFMAATRREVVLQAAVQRLSVAATTGATAPRSTIDTRTLGKPDTFSGEQGRWSDWKTVTTAYCAVISDRLGTLMQSIEDGSASNLKRALLTGQDPELGAQLFYILVMITRQQALTLVKNSGPQEGFLAWQRFIEHFEPTAKTRQAGQLLALLSWNFSHGDIQSQVELFDAAAHKYEVRAGDTLSDAMRIGIALRQMEDSPLRQHLLLNGSRLVMWKDFKSEITDVLRAMAAVGPTPMDVSALVKGGKPGGEGTKGVGKGQSTKEPCRNCGKRGHFAKECWAPGGGAAAARDGETGCDGGKAVGKDVKCWTCGKAGHRSGACRSKTLNSVETAAAAEAAGAESGGPDMDALFLSDEGQDDNDELSAWAPLHSLWVDEVGAEDEEEALDDELRHTMPINVQGIRSDFKFRSRLLGIEGVNIHRIQDQTGVRVDLNGDDEDGYLEFVLIGRDEQMMDMASSMCDDLITAVCDEYDEPDTASEEDDDSEENFVDEVGSGTCRASQYEIGDEYEALRPLTPCT